jgi:hypothetical protein
MYHVQIYSLATFYQLGRFAARGELIGAQEASIGVASNLYSGATGFESQTELVTWLH